jgi:hypothetical protein
VTEAEEAEEDIKNNTVRSRKGRKSEKHFCLKRPVAEHKILRHSHPSDILCLEIVDPEQKILSRKFFSHVEFSA